MMSQEFQPGGHEASPEVRIAELVTASADVVAQQRPILQQLMADAERRCVGPYEIQDVRLYAGIVDWQFFGQPGDQLPQGVAITDGQYDQACPYGYSYDPMYFTQQCATFAASRVDAAAMQTLRATVRADIRSRAEAVDAELATLLESTPTFQLVASCGIERPITWESPLTPQQRARRYGEVEAAVAEQRRANPHDPTLPRQRHRQLQAVDDETLRRRERPVAHDPLDRLYTLFKKPILDLYAQEHPDFDPSAPYTIVTDYDDDVPGACVPEIYLRQRADQLNDADTELFGLTYTLAQNWCETHDPGASVLSREIQIAFLSKCARLALDQLRPLGFDELLTLAKDAVIGEQRVSLTRWQDGEFMSSHSYGLRDALGTYIDTHDRYVAPPLQARPHDHESPKAHFSSAAELQQRRAQTIGQILQGSLVDTGEVQLIKPAPRVERALLPNHPDNDLVLSLGGDYITQDAWLPGYILNTRHNTIGAAVFGFIKDPESNPYRRCTIPLPPKMVEQLLQQYDELGLEPVVADLSESLRPTVDTLVRALRRASVYVKPPYIDDRYAPRAIQNLKDLGLWVQRGALGVQCEISGQALGVSLAAGFDTTTISQQGGHVIEADGRISASTHRQVAFIPFGDLYLLDATPRAFPEASSSSSVYGLSYTGVPRGIAPAAVPAPPAPFDTRLTRASEMTPGPTRQESLAAIRAHTEGQLQSLFGVASRQALYRTVRGLSGTDPAFRLLQTVAQVATTEQPQEHVEALGRFTTAYRQQTLAARRRYSRVQYPDTFFDMAQAQIDRLRTVLQSTD